MSDDPITIELNPSERRLYDRLRRQVVTHSPSERSSVRDMLLLLPDLVVLLIRMLRDPRVPPVAKALALVGVGYVLSPIDFVPGLLFGPIGLIDDVLVASATLSRLVNHVHPDVVRGHWPGQGDALQVIQRLAHWSETFFRDRLRGLLRRLSPTP